MISEQEIKVAVLENLLFERSHFAAFTEAFNNSDVLSITKNLYTYEFEIKCSRRDLVRELKAVRGAKNKVYGGPKTFKHDNYLRVDPTIDFVPNCFSFVVPPELVGIAGKGIKGTPYGLYSWPPGYNGQSIRPAVSPTKIHEEKIKEKDLLRLVRKASLEVCSLRRELIKNG